MTQDEVKFFRHEDGRWLRLVRSDRRIDRMEGERDRGLTCVYSIFKTPTAAATAWSKVCAAVQRKGFRSVTRLGRFVPVPLEQWRNAALVARSQRTVAKRASPRGPLEARVAELEETPGVTLRFERGRPASERALAMAEKELGRPLPHSLRAFLAEHDGLVVEWALDEKGWAVAFEIFSLRAMLKERKRRGAVLDLEDGRILPISPTYDRSVLGAVLRSRGEAKIVEWMEPPEGKPVLLAPDLTALVARSAKNFFVITGRKDVSEKWLPAIRRRFGQR